MMNMNLDTDFPRGANPQSVMGTAFQVASVLSEAMENRQTGGAGHAATSHTLGGLITTSALTTPPDEEYTFHLTNNIVNQEYLEGRSVEWPYDWSGWPAGHNWPWPYGRQEAMLREKPEAGIFSITNTGGRGFGIMSALMALTRIRVEPGHIYWTWRNMGLTALNGTMAILWHL